MKKKNFELLAQCIKSDQVSAKQIQEHLKNNKFREYYETKYLTPRKRVEL
jgi:hypothetical protein